MVAIPGTYPSQITCTGTDCFALENIPGVTCTNDSRSTQCTNNVECGGSSNLTSSFSTLVENNLTISGTQNVTIGNHSYVVTNSGANFSYVNSTTAANNSTSVQSCSSSWRLSRRLPTFKFSLLVGVIIFATHAIAQSPLDALNSQYSGAMGAILPQLETQLCQAIIGD